jgi:hypothetical protein
MNHQLGRWQSICREIQQHVVAANLDSASVEITQGILGQHRCEPLFANAVVRHHGEDLSRYEFPTLALVHQCCQEHECYVYYLHTKGVSHPINPKSERWRAELLTIVDDWQMWVASLSENDSAGPRWNDRYFAGNFWWARSEYIAKLPKLEQLDTRNRRLAERWIGMASSEARVYRR